jgi:hypothetical protein
LKGVKPLSGGYWNDVLRLDTDQGRMVLKHYRAVMAGSLFPNLPDDEAAALTRLKGTNVAPEPIGYWPDARVLIYGYVEGAHWAGDVDAMAALLARKSTVDPAGFRAVPMTPETILAAGDALYAPCQEDAITRRLRNLRPKPAAAPAGGWCQHPQLCHTDIGAANLIGAGPDLRLIDWQCPAAGDGAEDAYTFLSPAFQILNLHPPLTGAQRLRFLGLWGDAQSRARFHLLESAYAWRMAGYCCRRMQTAEDPVVRQRYGEAAQAEADLIDSLP